MIKIRNEESISRKLSKGRLCSLIPRTCPEAHTLHEEQDPRFPCQPPSRPTTPQRSLGPSPTPPQKTCVTGTPRKGAEAEDCVREPGSSRTSLRTEALAKELKPKCHSQTLFNRSPQQGTLLFLLHWNLRLQGSDLSLEDLHQRSQPLDIPKVVLMLPLHLVQPLLQITDTGPHLEYP